MLKKLLAMVATVFMVAAAYAATTHLKPGHPDQYVVKPGDTLWSVSSRFLTQPWYWPEIWQANPQVHNPHLIYPGDVLNLAYDHKGQPVIKLEPSVHVGKTPIPTIPLDQIKTFLRNLRVVDVDALKQSPYVVGFQNDLLRGIPGQFVYVRKLANATPGTRYAIVRPSHVFRKYDEPGNDGSDIAAHDLESNVELVPGPWKENFRNDGHYGRGGTLGIEVKVIGSAEVLRTGDPTTLLITSSTTAIRKGDRLMPADNHPYDAHYYPHAPKSAPGPGARVIAFTGAMAAVGKDQVIALSVGSANGVDNGTTFSLFRPGDVIKDDVAGNFEHHSFGPHVKLPDEYVGHAMVFRTFKHVSYALVMGSIHPVNIGDRVELPQ